MRSVGTASLVAFAAGQQKGTLGPNYLMPIGLGECTSSGCTDSQKSLALDANWRWNHKVGQATNCYTGSEWDTSVCPDGETCAQNCAVGGVDQQTWESTYGVKQTGNGVQLDFVTEGPYSKNVGSRSYVMDDSSNYKLFKMLNKEIAFDIDVSNMPCGLNSAIYFSEMDASGDASATNKAGAAYGTGYCDGQCARDLKWVKGKANVEGWNTNPDDPYDNSGIGEMGACCAEMDLWEANSIATAFTPHPASGIQGLHVCMGDEECGAQDGDRYVAPTDRDGCDLNAYRMGETTFYGPGSQFKVDTTKPFTVITRFHATGGELTEIEQLYVQDGQEIHHPSYSLGADHNSESDEFCNAQKASFGDRNSFKEKGGMKAMGEALDRGMVFVISLWDDIAVNMNWLDSVMEGDDPSQPGTKRGPCDPAAGKPETLREAHPDSSYVMSNLRWGDLGTTTNYTPTPTPGPTPSPTPAGGSCCWGGSSCDTASDCHVDAYCGASEGQCTGNCAGTWCGKAAEIV